MSYVWGIGLTRTGTKSLNMALEQLGYQSVHWPTTRQLLYDEITAAADESVAVVYKYLDFRRPGSKFVLTERDEESWLRSTAAHRGRFFANAKVEYRRPPADPAAPGGASLSASIRRSADQIDAISRQRDRTVELVLTQTALYETLEFDEAKFRAGYRRHHADVARYFADRPDDLLRLRICDGEGWEKLAPFLGRPIPDVAFPHEHQSQRAAS
jgi:hypothetical protein